MTGDWRLVAACRDMPFDVFFPPRGEPTEPAKAVCRGCPSRADCLDEALATSSHHDFGVRGGTSTRERRGLRRGRGRRMAS